MDFSTTTSALIIDMPTENLSSRPNESPPEVKVLRIENTTAVQGTLLHPIDIVSEAENPGDANVFGFCSSTSSTNTNAGQSQIDTQPEEVEIYDRALENTAIDQTNGIENQNSQIANDSVLEITMVNPDTTGSPIESQQDADDMEMHRSITITKDAQTLGKISLRSSSDPNAGNEPAHATNTTETLIEAAGSSVQAKDTIEGTATDDDSSTLVYDESATTDEEKASIRVGQNAEPIRNVPPHMRRDFQSPASRRHVMHDTKQTGYTVQSSHRPYRPGYPMYALPPHRVDFDREQVAHLKSQLMRAQDDLHAERKKNISLLEANKAEQQHKIEAAFSTMLFDLLQRQMETHAISAKNEATAQRLEYREQKIKQLEVYLSEGQKHLHCKLDKRGIRFIDVVEREHIRRDAELAIQKDIAIIESDITNRFECLHLRESAQRMREQQYKALVRNSLESELLEKALAPEKASEIAEFEYNTGFAAGKEAVRHEAEEDGRKKGFVEGYKACQRAFTAIADLKAGRIAQDSPELDFLYDAGHPENPYNFATRLGEGGNETVPTGDGKMEMKRASLNGGLGKDFKGATHKSAQPHPPLPPPPPPTPSFASQLRGIQTTHMHNGHAVLANSSASFASTSTSALSLTSAATSAAAAAATTTALAHKPNGTNGVKSSSQSAGHTSQDERAGKVTNSPIGRRSTQNQREENGREVKAENLIDLS